MQFILLGHSFRHLLSFLFVGFSYEYRCFLYLCNYRICYMSWKNLDKNDLDDLFFQLHDGLSFNNSVEFLAKLVLGCTCFS